MLHGKRLTAAILAPAMLAVLMGSLTAKASDAAPMRRPNIVLIVADDLHYNELGCFGNKQILTPQLDKLAEKGVRLTNFYVTWPACTPSRGSILTGRYPQRNGLYAMIRNDMVNYRHQYTEYEYSVSPEMTLGMDMREIMISQVLKEAGYATGVVGKWDGGRARRFLPLARGFDFFYGFANTGIDYFTHERYGIPSLFSGNQQIKEEGYATDLFRREALKFIDRNHDRPFFLYLPFNAPHMASNYTGGGVQAKPEDMRRWYPELDPKSKQAGYAACVTNMDEAIGEIMATLDRHGLTDNTLMVFLSDNGGHNQTDCLVRGGKGQLLEGGIRVCALARFPGRIPAGTVSDEFLSTLELFPTCCAVAGTSLPEGVIYDGFNMLPVLEGKANSQRTEMYWQHRLDRAARVGNYKWIDSKDYGGLFDLAADLREEHDLSAAQPEVLARMKAKFSAWRQAMDHCEPRGPFRDY
jgi:arylsulfatase A